MRNNKTSTGPLRAMALTAAVTVIGLTAAGCTGVTPGAYNPGVETASVNAGQSDVTRVAALLQVGIQQANQQKWPAATTTFQDVLLINPSNVYALYDLGVIDQSTGKPAEAMGFYKQALTVNKKYTPAMYNEAILLEKSNPQQAISLYQQVVTINPQASTAYLRLSFLQAKQGNRSAAELSYAKAVAIEPGLGKYPLPAAPAPATVTASPTRS